MICLKLGIYNTRYISYLIHLLLDIPHLQLVSVTEILLNVQVGQGGYLTTPGYPKYYLGKGDGLGE